MELSHKFKVGQSVQLVNNEQRLKPLGTFEVVRVMPTEHGHKQYRIRSLLDGHERVAMEGELV